MSDNIWMRVLAAVGVAVVLIGDGLVLATQDWAGAGGAESVPSALSPVLPGLQSFVEEARGLKFKKAVKVELLSAEEFADRLQGDDELDGEEAGPGDGDAFEGFLRALGLVHGPIDLDAASQAILEDGIVGFYDHEEKRLFVRGVKATPFVQQVLVHELTHALEDQHFNLNRPSLDRRNDESALSFRALVEGSAVTVEEAFLNSLSQSDRQAAMDEEEALGGAADADLVPEVVARLISYPYAIGPRLVEALVDGGGSAGLDRALMKPPITSEQTLHPEKFFADERPADVVEPFPDGELIERGVLGEAVLFLILDEVLPAEVARRAAAGWGGDQYVAWADGGRTCIKWNLVMDSSADTAEVVSGLRTWETENPGATVRGGDTVTVTNCG